MKFLADPNFLNFFVPLITVVFSIFLKIVSRNDKFVLFKKEDLAVGLELAVTALILFITQSANLAHQLVFQTASNTSQVSDKLTAVPWIILAFILGIWGVSSLVRWFGWESNDRLRFWRGIIAPNLFGLVLLGFVVNWIR